MADAFARLGTGVKAAALLGVLGTVAAAAAPVAWHLAGWSGAAVPPPARSTMTAPSSAPELVNVTPILDFAPFGTRVVEAEPLPEGPIGETSLDLVLRGVVVQTDPAQSTAFIGHDGRTDGYRIDDEVAGQARLVEVAADRVVLEVEGQRQTLSFPDPGGAALASGTAPATETNGADRLRAAIAAQNRSADTAVATAPTTTQDYIDLWRDRIRANPAEVLDAIGLIPAENGYRIAEEHDSGVTRAGLREGDVVTSVNGQAVGDVERDRQLFDEVAASGQARLEIERDGRTIVMSFPLQ